MKTISIFIILLINFSIILYPMIMNSMNPMNFMINFLLYTIFSMLIYYLKYNNPLYSMMILITIVGGMMIMFNYFLSLINNEKMKLKFYFYIMNLILMMFYLMIFMKIYYLNFFLFIDYTNLMNNNFIYIYKIFCYPLFFFSMIMMIFILINLILAFKMCTMKIYPLRKIKM